MSPNESSEIQSPDVESLLKQMTLRKPSDQLDATIACLVATNEASEPSVSVGRRFGWKAILATATVAALSGVWLGSFFMLSSEANQSSNLAAVELNSPDASLLTSVSFNVQAFNLLHGHSQLAEYTNCGQCHQQAAVQVGAAHDATLAKVFKGWFYGDEHFFETHAGGIGDCSQCHLAAKAVEPKADNGEFGRNVHAVFDKLANCSECHKVETDGFDGFKKDWRTELSSSKG